ncbi:MAG: helix-turn-helix domain-containing protein [Clostridia bacterium]|nr:helix-turn-helix domain-containing protein [Clostridia bacterium]
MHAKFLLSREENHQLDISEVKNRNYPFHFHSHIEICLMLDGEMEVWINDHQKLLRRGELSVAWSYDAHYYHTPSKSHSISMIIPPVLFEEYSSKLNNRHSCEPFLSDSCLFAQLEGWIRGAKACDDEMIQKGYVYVILGTLLKQMRFEEDSTRSGSRFSSQVLLYLNEHFREDVTLSSVAHALGYHPNHLSHAFKNLLHIGFNRYLTVLRLREAVLLMQKGNRNVTECAYASGFQSLRTFYRAFQSEFECTPREFITAALKQ